MYYNQCSKSTGMYYNQCLWTNLMSRMNGKKTHTHTSTAIDFNARLQKQVRPHFAHVILITDIWSILTYIARASRPTCRTLYTIPPSMLLSVYGGGVRYYPLVLQTNPFGSGWFHGINLRSCPGGDVNTTLSAAKYFGFISDSPRINLPREPMLLPIRGCPSWSPCEPQDVSCSTSGCLEGNDKM